LVPIVPQAPAPRTPFISDEKITCHGRHRVKISIVSGFAAENVSKFECKKKNGIQEEKALGANAWIGHMSLTHSHQNKSKKRIYKPRISLHQSETLEQNSYFIDIFKCIRQRTDGSTAIAPHSIL